MSMWVCYTCHALLFGGVGLAYRAWISVVFSTLFGHCEGLKEREEQTNFTLFVYFLKNSNSRNLG